MYWPSNRQLTTLLRIKRFTLTTSKEAIITGDFSCPNVDWGLLTRGQEGSRSKRVGMVQRSFLAQVVIQPIWENSLLDLIPVSDPDLIRDCVVNEKLRVCDHCLIRFNVNIGHKFVDNPSVMPDKKKHSSTWTWAASLAAGGQVILTDSAIDNAWNILQDKLLEADKLDTRKSTGADSLSPRLLKELKQQILQPLTNVFNRSL